MIYHHIPNWKNCLKELKRVLKSNGELILEDLSSEIFQKTIDIKDVPVLALALENFA